MCWGGGGYVAGPKAEGDGLDYGVSELSRVFPKV